LHAAAAAAADVDDDDDGDDGGLDVNQGLLPVPVEVQHLAQQFSGPEGVGRPSSASPSTLQQVGTPCLCVCNTLHLVRPSPVLTAHPLPCGAACPHLCVSEVVALSLPTHTAAGGCPSLV